MGAGVTRLARRMRFGASAAIVVIATTISCVMINLIAERIGPRIDVTAMGEHQLSERTRKLIRSLDDEYEIVIAADWAMTDRRVGDRVRDAASRFDEASGRITTSILDTGSARGIEDFDAMLGRLASRDAGEIEEQHETLVRGAAALDGPPPLFPRLPPSLTEISEQLTGTDTPTQQARAYFQQQATLAGNGSTQIADYAETLRGHLTAQTEPVGLPRYEEAKTLVGPVFDDVDSILGAMIPNLVAFADSDAMPEEQRSLARRLERTIRIQRDDARVVADAIDKLETLDLVRVSRAMGAGEAAIVIGPESVVGVDPQSLLPPGQWLDEQRGVEADIGRRAEELLASAIGALASPNRPIVVVMHTQPRRFLDLKELQVMNVVRERLELYAIDFAEWLVLSEPDPPDLSDINPDGTRPVVYVVIGTDTAANTEDGASGPESAEALAKAMERVVDEGRPLMVSLVPSTMPAYGMEDPMLRPLIPFGITAETAKPIMQRQLGSDGQGVSVQRRIEAEESEHPLYEAIRGLPTTLHWPIGLRLEDVPGDATAERAVLLRIDDSESWGETQWLQYWQTPPERRRALPNVPQRDEGRDWTDGPFPVALAAELRREDAPRPQRLVVVGSFDWFFDRWTRDAQLVDERIVATNPGNAELFEASVLWLAGQDELIARSPTGRATPRIPPMEPARLSALRWSLVGGLPGLVLLLGALWWLLSR